MDLDSSIIGLTGKPFTVDVEKRHITQFAKAIGDENPLYLDEEFAKESIYEGIIVPPTFLIALASEGDGIPLEMDERRMLHGEQEFEYHRPVYLGDRLSCQMKVSDLYDREGKSGPMKFIVLDTEMKNENSELVANSRMTIVYRNLAG
ncbi:MaoC family dehydratase [Virgibacillus sp. MSP4-1]|uniref:MaoC family dehydratase N-terminal domain-containing protein n=1 Tax=Virgibacillus sp. MSP4-1 TaxID=2700081 RepID=UPI0003A4E585|nr:MaoC family dehydratase N-terminal domain-containing protein [Virgibacillus sp. MSP4-1]QHS23428.1 MaoC family dehydratase [Virgibacillus sp. MSP4-1]